MAHGQPEKPRGVAADDVRLVLFADLDPVEQMGDQHKYPENFSADGKRLPLAAQVLYGADIGGKGTFFAARLTVKTDGKIVAEAGALRIEGATEATVIVSAASSFNGPNKSPSREGIDPSLRTTHDLREAAAQTFATLRERHIADYTALFHRVSLRLDGDPAKEKLPTDARIAAFRASGDPALAMQLFQFGRYLLIAGSRAGSQPLNLQGKWNDLVIPPWASQYTVNINTEMNYWPAETTNLSELHEPLFRLIRKPPSTAPSPPARCITAAAGLRTTMFPSGATVFRSTATPALHFGT